MKKYLIIFITIICFGISINALSGEKSNSKTITVAGTVKMCLLDEEGNLTPINKYRKTDWMKEVIVFIFHADKPVNISSGENCRDCSNGITSQIVIHASQNPNINFVNFNNKKVRLTGSINCPCAGWRNYNGIVMKVLKVIPL